MEIVVLDAKYVGSRQEVLWQWPQALFTWKLCYEHKQEIGLSEFMAQGSWEDLRPL